MQALCICTCEHLIFMKLHCLPSCNRNNLIFVELIFANVQRIAKSTKFTAVKKIFAVQHCDIAYNLLLVLIFAKAMLAINCTCN